MTTPENADGLKRCPNPDGCGYCAEHGCPRTPDAALVEALAALSSEVQLLRMAVQADDPKRELMLRIGDIDTALATLTARAGG